MAMVYTDGVHLVCKNVDELHVFAKKIGLKRSWYQYQYHHRHPHYDLTTHHKMEIAVQNGAVVVTSRQLIGIPHDT